MEYIMPNNVPLYIQARKILPRQKLVKVCDLVSKCAEMIIFPTDCTEVLELGILIYTFEEGRVLPKCLFQKVTFSGCLLSFKICKMMNKDTPIATNNKR